jgi:hypothetical protein
MRKLSARHHLDRRQQLVQNAHHRADVGIRSTILKGDKNRNVIVCAIPILLRELDRERPIRVADVEIYVDTRVALSRRLRFKPTLDPSDAVLGQLPVIPRRELGLADFRLESRRSAVGAARSIDPVEELAEINGAIRRLCMGPTSCCSSRHR